MKYELLLRDIYKHTERAGLLQELPSLQDAIYVMKVGVIEYQCDILYYFIDRVPSSHTMHTHHLNRFRLFQKRRMT